jgi:riboflavin synthase
MFAGIVEALGRVDQLQSTPPGQRLWVQGEQVAETTRVGDSIAVNGCCLTVVERDGSVLIFDVGPETLRCTNLGDLRAGDRVNLERSLVVGDRLGGHLVTGHVDAVGYLDQRVDQRDWSTVWVRCPGSLTLQMAAKGSIAVDGVSLTLVEVTDQAFSVALIPHTLAVTTLGRKRPGDAVNLETDLLAKYVQRQWTAEHAHRAEHS